MRDPAAQLIEELELGDARMAEYRPRLLEAIAGAVKLALELAADAMEAGDQDAIETALDAVDLGDLPDLQALLEEMAAASFEAGQARGRELADELPGDRDEFEEGIPRRAGMELAERVSVLAGSWRDVLREAIRARLMPVLRGVVTSPLPADKLGELAPLLRGIEVTLVPREEAPERAEAIGEEREPVEPVAAAHVLPDSADDVEAYQRWLEREIPRQAEALRSTIAEQTVIGLDVEANELGKLDAAENDKRVRVVRFVAVRDEHTTCLCGGLHDMTMSVRDPRRIEYMPPLHINCRSSISFDDIPESSVNIDEVRTVTVNDRVGGKVFRNTYTVAPGQIHPSALGGTSPPPKMLSEVIS